MLNYNYCYLNYVIYSFIKKQKKVKHFLDDKLQLFTHISEKKN